MTGNVSTVGAGVHCGEAETAVAEAEGADLGGHASESEERIETVCTCMQMMMMVVSHLNTIACVGYAATEVSRPERCLGS